MSGKNSQKLLWKHCEIQLPRYYLCEPTILGSAFYQAFKRPKIQNFENQGATSGICWVYYKPPVLSCSEVGTYVTQTFEPKILIFNFQQEVLKFSDNCVSWSSPKTDLRIKFLNMENGSLENISFSY